MRVSPSAWTLVAATVAALSVAPGASAGSVSRDRPWNTDGQRTAPAPAVSARQHGGNQHLPAAAENLEVVGRLSPTGGPGGKVIPDQIADVAVHKGFAYLNSWASVDPGQTVCTRGGFYSIDIRDPANPREVAFTPARPETYHGEGAHAATLNLPGFQGEVLAVNNELCGANGVGGFDLYDVSNPSAPVALVQGAGDKSPDESTVQNPLGNTNNDPAGVAHSAHSVFIWQPIPTKAYAVLVDNTEFSDVDIFDISDPRSPVFVADIDVLALAQAQGFDVIGNAARGLEVLHHDSVVKKIGDRWTLLVNYWDVGYIQIDISNPSVPRIVGDTDFGPTEPFGSLPAPDNAPEGNGHQSEFSADDQFILAADEDFAAFRTTFSISDGPNAGAQPSGEFGFVPSVATLADRELNGPTIYGGYGCSADNQIPPASSAPARNAGEEAIVVLQRGPNEDGADPDESCRFDEKIANADAAGYDGVIVGAKHEGSPDRDVPVCGSGDPQAIRALCVNHETMHLIFNTEPNFDVPYPAPGTEPAVGATGARVAATARFDGWGYAHLYDRASGQKIDDFAIAEALDPAYATGFGDLSIHEFATDPTEPLAYSSYYSGGMRVLSFNREHGLVEQGKFIDQGGSNFWGVEQFTDASGNRLIAGSDRDYGLVILRYTGPGAAAPPSCDGVSATTGSGASVSVPLRCRDPNGNAITRRITAAPANGTLGAVDEAAGAVTYTPRGGFAGTDTFSFAAADPAAQGAPAVANVRVAQAPRVLRTVTWRRLSLRTLLRGRYAVRANCVRACTMRARLRTRLPGSRRTVTIATATKRKTTPGAAQLRFRVSRTYRARVRRAMNRRRRLSVSASVRALDAEGRPVTLSRRLRARPR